MHVCEAQVPAGRANSVGQSTAERGLHYQRHAAQDENRCAEHALN